MGNVANSDYTGDTCGDKDNGTWGVRVIGLAEACPSPSPWCSPGDARSPCSRHDDDTMGVSGTIRIASASPVMFFTLKTRTFGTVRKHALKYTWDGSERERE